MKMRNKYYIYLLIFIIICRQLSPVILAESDVEEIKITSKAEFLDFIQKCTLDAWSKNKQVILVKDIDLTGEEVKPIPIFCGFFDGGGHQIKGLHMDRKFQSGLFNIIEKGATVANLQVFGEIQAIDGGQKIAGIAGINRGTLISCEFSGKVKGKNEVAGIAAENMESGKIINCQVSGNITGKNYVGGVVGNNKGYIKGAINHSAVNIENQESELKISEFDFGVLSDLSKLRTSRNISGPTNVGGIAGFSSGTITQSENKGNIGYPHIGYNIGGIVGRTSGYVSYCSNSGKLNGRKDVGGIAGQMEPYLKLNIGEDILNKLKDQLHEMNQIVNESLTSIQGKSDLLYQNMSKVSNSLSDSMDQVYYLSDLLEKQGSNAIDQINRSVDILADSVNQLAEISKVMTPLSDDMQKGMKSLTQAVKEMSNNGKIAASGLQELNLAISEMEEGSAQLQSGLNQIGNGLNELENALVIKDQEAMKNALNIIRQGINQMIDANNNIVPAITNIVEVLKANGILSPEIFQETETILEEFKSVNQALNQILNGLKQGIENVSLDINNISSGLSSLESGSHTLAASTTNIKTAAEHLRNSITDFSRVAENADDTTVEIINAVDSFTKVASSANKAAILIEKWLTDLSLEEKPKLINQSSEIRNSGNQVYHSVNQLIEDINQLNSVALSSSKVFVNSARKINDQAKKVQDTIIKMLQKKDTKLEDIYKDTSKIDFDSIIHGKLYRCENQGKIYGDVNAGGVAGLMAIEYDYDPEDDILKPNSKLLNQQYETKAVMQNCINYGEVIAKKNYAGGIVGQMNMGFVTGCQGYGKVKSEEGDYIGGIAGKSDSVIHSSFAKINLWGRDYVGGITGLGSQIENCYAMPELSKWRTFAGAISGNDDLVLKQNYFVSKQVAGANMVSYQGKAEPITYDQLVAVPEIPEEFKKIKISFKADDKIIKQEYIDYGKTVSKDMFPPIPKKEGYYGVWDNMDVEALYFDREWNVRYENIITSLAGEQLRENGKPIFLVEGQFTERYSLATDLLGKGIKDIKPILPSGIYKNFLKQVFSKIDYSNSEHWRILLPNDKQTIHCVRFCPIDMPEDTVVFIKNDNQWQKVVTEQVGSYLLVDTNGNRIELLAISTEKDWYKIGFGIGILVFILIILILKRKHKNKKEKKEEKELKKENMDK